MGDPQLSGQKSIKAFVIHLKRAHQRTPQVERLVASLPVPTEIIDAVDSRTLTQSHIERVYQPHLHQPHYPFSLSTNEIACFLSHRKAWQAIIDQKLDAGFVVEDDVGLEAKFPEIFATACMVLKAGDFIRFPFRSNRETGVELYSTDGIRIIEPLPVGLGMVAQLISYDAAKCLLTATQNFDRPVDTTVQMSWLTGLHPRSILPGGVEEISSSLGGSTIKQRKSIIDKLKREILRPLYRRQVAFYSRKSR